MSKILTDDLILEKLADNNVYPPEDICRAPAGALQISEGRDIYFQDYDDDAENYEFQEVIDEVYDNYFNDKKQEVENELIDEGYEWEEE